MLHPGSSCIATLKHCGKATDTQLPCHSKADAASERWEAWTQKSVNQTPPKFPLQTVHPPPWAPGKTFMIPIDPPFLPPTHSLQRHDNQRCFQLPLLRPQKPISRPFLASFTGDRGLQDTEPRRGRLHNASNHSFGSHRRKLLLFSSLSDSYPYIYIIDIDPPRYGPQTFPFLFPQ